MLNLFLSSSSPGLTTQNPKPFCVRHSFSSIDSIAATRLNPTLSLSPQPKPPDPKPSPSNAAAPTTSNSKTSGASSPPRIYVGHSIYKGKAALTVDVRPPEFTPLETGAFKMTKEGYVLLQFAPAAGVRQYDWGRKQVFSLSVTEMGTIMSLGLSESCEFFHDPFKGKSEEGKVRKVLKVEPLPDGTGHFFNLSVRNMLINLDESIYIPITRAEYTVLVSAFNFIVPYLIGWHTFASSIRRPEDTSRVNNANSRSSTDFEWSR
ncbi:ssDNA-binding transcriptional regulator [Actinidia rufa]|uniref:SsDNA-binding transcriptional regulator n=1 Tax=Actinidia rufa TaxID=165716 RepID=A0A7J0EPK7_9ERIC|nr:ssDNA-binding transcriptional regulator [Actinidia rufa]